MSSFANQPENFNYFNPTGFKFIIDKVPNVNFFCQSATIPGLSLGEAVQVNPFRDIPIPGDKIQFEELTIRFIVDEELKNWTEIYNWLYGLGYPENLEQSAEVSKPSLMKPLGTKYSDATLLVLTSNKNVQHRVVFQNIFPVTLSQILMDSSVAEVEYITADVTFAYTIYNIERMIGER